MLAVHKGFISLPAQDLWKRRTWRLKHRDFFDATGQRRTKSTRKWKFWKRRYLTVPRICGERFIQSCDLRLRGSALISLYSVVLDREWPACPPIWVGTSRDQKELMQKTLSDFWSLLSEPDFRARKKPININIFGGTVSGTNRNRPWDKWDPSPGQNGTRPLGQTGLSLFNSTVKSPFCPVCPWDGWGFVPGTIVPQGPFENCLCVFCLLVFLAPKIFDPELRQSGFGLNFWFRRVPPCAVQTCAVRPGFAPVVGELQAANPSKCPRAHEAKC